MFPYKSLFNFDFHKVSKIEQINIIDERWTSNWFLDLSFRTYGQFKKLKGNRINKQPSSTGKKYLSVAMVFLSSLMHVDFI